MNELTMATPTDGGSSGQSLRRTQQHDQQNSEHRDQQQQQHQRQRGQYQPSAANYSGDATTLWTADAYDTSHVTGGNEYIAQHQFDVHRQQQHQQSTSIYITPQTTHRQASLSTSSMHRQPKAVPWKRDPQVTGTAASDITTPRALPGATSADITKTATPNRGVPATSSAPLSLSIGSAKRPWQSVIAARLAASNAKAEGDVITTSAGGSGQVTNGNTLHQITNDNTEHQFTNDKTDDHQIANGKTEGEHQTTNANKNEVLMQEMATTSDMDMELAATVKRRRPRLSRLVTKAETVAETAAATATPSSRPAYLTKPVFIAPSPFTPSSAPLYTLPTGMTTEQLVSVLAATGNMGATSGSGLASTPHHHQYPPHLARLAASDIMSFSFGNNNNSSSAAGKRRPRNGGMTPTIDYAHPYTHKRAVAPATRQSITELIDRCDQGVQRAKLLEMEIAALKEKAAGGDGQDVDATTKMTTSSMMRTMSPAAVMVSGNAARVGMGRSGDHAFAMVGSPVSSSTGSTGIDAAFK